jgi:hypothetical protein
VLKEFGVLTYFKGRKQTSTTNVAEVGRQQAQPDMSNLLSNMGPMLEQMMMSQFGQPGQTPSVSEVVEEVADDNELDDALGE